MSLFARNKRRDVQSFVLHLLNNHCPDLAWPDHEEVRGERRANLLLVVMVVPIRNGKPNVQGAFATVTKEFATTGVSLVLNEPRLLEEVYLVFRSGGRVTCVRALAKHMSPLGGGFFQLGMEITEVVPEGDLPELLALAEEFH